jgi:hypothetical protein
MNIYLSQFRVSVMDFRKETNTAFSTIIGVNSFIQKERCSPHIYINYPYKFCKLNHATEPCGASGSNTEIMAEVILHASSRRC